MSQLIHTSNAQTVVISDYDQAVFNAMLGGFKAKEKMETTLANLIKTKHKVLMAFGVYEHEVAAIKHLVEEKGFAKSNDWYQRQYRAAVESVFGAIPVSMVDSTREKYLGRLDDGKRATYDKALSAAIAENKPVELATALAVKAAKSSAKQVKQPKAGAPAGETKPQSVTEETRIEQQITTIGLFKSIDAIVRILNAAETTIDQGKALNSLRNRLAKIIKPAEVKAA